MDIFDGVAFVGLVAVVAGVYQYSPSLSLIVLGLVLALLGTLGSLRSRRKDDTGSGAVPPGGG